MQDWNQKHLDTPSRTARLTAVPNGPRVWAIVLQSQNSSVGRKRYSTPTARGHTRRRVPGTAVKLIYASALQNQPCLSRSILCPLLIDLSQALHQIGPAGLDQALTFFRVKFTLGFQREDSRVSMLLQDLEATNDIDLYTFLAIGE